MYVQRIRRNQGRLLTQQFFGVHGTQSRPAVMPMDAFRDGQQFVVRFDLPGVSPDSIDLDADHIEANYDQGVLTLCIPVAAQAKSRKIAVTAGAGAQAVDA